MWNIHCALVFITLPPACREHPVGIICLAGLECATNAARGGRGEARAQRGSKTEFSILIHGSGLCSHLGGGGMQRLHSGLGEISSKMTVSNQGIRSQLIYHTEAGTHARLVLVCSSGRKVHKYIQKDRAASVYPPLLWSHSLYRTTWRM